MTAEDRERARAWWGCVCGFLSSSWRSARSRGSGGGLVELGRVRGQGTPLAPALWLRGSCSVGSPCTGRTTAGGSGDAPTGGVALRRGLGPAGCYDGGRSQLSQILSSPWLNVALAVVCLVIGSVVTRHFGTYKKLTHQVRSFGFVFGGVNKLAGMELRYRGHGPSVENLTVSRIVIWNTGRGDVKKGDIMGSGILRIAIDPKYVILAAEVVQQKNTDNNFEVSTAEDLKAVTICFDFVRPGEGVVLQIVHTGAGSKDLTVAGTLADVRISRSRANTGDQGASVNMTIVTLGLLFLGAALGGAIVALFLGAVPPSDPVVAARLPQPVRIAVALWLGAVLLGEMYLIRRFGKAPRGLEKFDESF